MSRKHFKAIADALKDADADLATIEAVAAALRQFNPRFNKSRFIAAARSE